MKVDGVIVRYDNQRLVVEKSSSGDYGNGNCAEDSTLMVILAIFV